MKIKQFEKQSKKLIDKLEYSKVIAKFKIENEVIKLDKFDVVQTLEASSLNLDNIKEVSKNFKKETKKVLKTYEKLSNKLTDFSQEIKVIGEYEIEVKICQCGLHVNIKDEHLIDEKTLNKIKKVFINEL